jgi:hypothetical protein
VKTIIHLAALAFALSLAWPCAAQEYFGDFLDRLKGAFDAQRQPRPVFKLEGQFRFRDPNGLLWSTPAGAEVDGASIPQAFWSFIGGPFEGAYINASVIHDHYCVTKERTAHDTHRNFYYGMRASGVPDWKAKLMHWAVSTFGPSWKLERRIVLIQRCTKTGAAEITCSTEPKEEPTLVTVPPPDLSDPEVLAVAISKANAIARTLLTTQGKVLDVTAAGQVAATVENIQTNSAVYRSVFASKDYASSAAKLGVLSQSAGRSPGEVAPWSGNRVPTFGEAVVLTPNTERKVDQAVPYKLEPRSKDLIRNRIDMRSLESSTTIRQRAQ